MNSKRTFALIKPGAVRKNHYGEIIYIITKAGFALKAMKMIQLSEVDAQRFYAMHEGKEFFGRLTKFISSGPVVALVLEKENAIEEFRKLIGSTDPAQAEDGTIRKLFGESVTMNAVHGSDSPENAQKEWSFFFAQKEILD
ncbi:MAG: nucleoside-diphosphate kinase [Tenuifilaceae bacterium]|jgi:nucleoside-diphosphate kinase|nr:nucleoside-diphosphate kinase [Tenuifilaceae bacterium]